MLEEAAFGAGRGLLYAMRENHRVNKTEMDADNLMTQLFNFRLRRGETLAMYKKRLGLLKQSLETTDADPEPISAKLHRRVYVAGLRVNPVFDKALNKITDVNFKSLKYIHAKMIEASGEVSKRIRELFGNDEEGVSVVQNVVGKSPPAAAPQVKKSLNNKVNRPD